MIDTLDRDYWIDRTLSQMRESVSLLGTRAPMLGEMAEYHLGWSEDLAGQVRFRGKMFRPLIAVFTAQAVGGRDAGEAAVPLAAAIELLHNFTLIHDDIQDNSPARRHRPTVWAKWGEAQAINAGDALFAAAHIALAESVARGVPPAVVIELIRGFDATTIEIVSGQVLDLQFEQGQRVTSEAYIEMITGKTARIVEFAAGGGAWIAGAPPEMASKLAEFGLALGLGFQVQDDLLGTFGLTTETGKAEADDIRRKKQSLPVLLLHQNASADDRARLSDIFQQYDLGTAQVVTILEMMERNGIEQITRSRVAHYHDQALAALEATGLPESALGPLMALTRRLKHRTG